ncbi:hypothetical protein [Tranquillimonas alkanivorans]|uniref:Uncharacterized protein n=1 Tax=Tranquillimonas alkanivorans TaxID=441119 RepID=A0A1I5L691_9RHOB|nr:hypothetical protein [Tranquillimonas alkanivorans]SFO92874.1 hypothetical protein SAMN04488047_101492 [Tranquillimonas alkanivorans]
MISWLRDLNRRRRLGRRSRLLARAVRGGEHVLGRAKVAGRRVAVVGPADTVTEEARSVDLAGYDVIVRMNRSLTLQGAALNTLGGRTDMLFHNFKQEGVRSASPLDPAALRRHGVGTVVFPHASDRSFSSAFFDQARRLKDEAGVETQVVDPALYGALTSKLEGRVPTTGATAVAAIAALDPAELCVIGFTFFQTGYSAAYNPQIATGDAARDWAAQEGLHDPAREARVIRRRLEEAEARGVALRLGAGVSAALGRAD